MKYTQNTYDHNEYSNQHQHQHQNQNGDHHSYIHHNSNHKVDYAHRQYGGTSVPVNYKEEPLTMPKKFLFLVPVIFALFAIFWSGWLINNNNDDMTDSEYSAKKVLKTSV